MSKKMDNQKYIVGIDVGGTFTDLLCLDTETQELLSEKVPSIPGRQWEGVLGALEETASLSDAARSALGQWLDDLAARVGADKAASDYIAGLSASQG